MSESLPTLDEAIHSISEVGVQNAVGAHFRVLSRIAAVQHIGLKAVRDRLKTLFDHADVEYAMQRIGRYAALPGLSPDLVRSERTGASEKLRFKESA
jgi:hypothetical protein